MKALVCEMCGSKDIVKQDGYFVCQFCSVKYSPKEAKKMMIEGAVEVQGTVQVDNSPYVKKYLQNAQRALAKEDWEEVEKYYNMVEQNAPDNIEAVFFSSYGKAMLAMTDSNYFKRQQKFEVLNRSIAVISDYYETTKENKEEVLQKIAVYINKMYDVTVVYQRQSIDLAGAIRALGGATGSKQWCINLIDSTKAAFVKELEEISFKHKDPFIIELICKFDPLYAQKHSLLPSKPEPNCTIVEDDTADSSIDNLSSTFPTTIVLGIIGMIVSWLLAIAGHIICIIGIVLGIKEIKQSYKYIGLSLCIIGEIFAIVSSIIGAWW